MVPYVFRAAAFDFEPACSVRALPRCLFQVWRLAILKLRFGFLADDGVEDNADDQFSSDASQDGRSFWNARFIALLGVAECCAHIRFSIPTKGQVQAADPGA